MKALRNPWLGALVALAALGLYARIETPLAALAIGLPFAATAWVYACFGPQLANPRGLWATPPRQLLPGGVGIVMAVLAVGWFAYMVYGLVTERGVIGWLNAVQAERDGKFSTKLSFIVAFLDLVGAMGLIGLAGAWLGRGRAPAGATAPAPVPPSAALQAAVAPLRNPSRVALWMFAGLAVGAWVIGYPVYLWIAAQHREDVQADYVRVAIDAPAVAWPAATHVSLDGRPQGDQVLVLKEGNQARRTFFVPLTGRAWTPEQPVQAVLTFDAEVPPQLDHPILGRMRSDALPRAAIDAFARSGVRIDPAHRLIDLVPSQQGRVADRSDDDRLGFLMLAGFISITSVLGALMFWLVMKFKGRAPRAQVQ